VDLGVGTGLAGGGHGVFDQTPVVGGGRPGLLLGREAQAGRRRDAGAAPRLEDEARRRAHHVARPQLRPQRRKLRNRPRPGGLHRPIKNSELEPIRNGDRSSVMARVQLSFFAKHRLPKHQHLFQFLNRTSRLKTDVLFKGQKSTGEGTDTLVTKTLGPTIDS